MFRTVLHQDSKFSGFFFLSTSCPNVFGPSFWHRLVQEIGWEEHLFYILSEKTFAQEHCAITKKEEKKRFGR